MTDGLGQMWLRTGSRTRAFTMIELVVSLAVVSILLAAMGSTIMLATKALPSGTDPDDRVVGACSRRLVLSRASSLNLKG